MQEVHTAWASSTAALAAQVAKAEAAADVDATAADVPALSPAAAATQTPIDMSYYACSRGRPANQARFKAVRQMRCTAS